MPIVLCSEKARTEKSDFSLVAGDSSYSNHKFSSRVFLSNNLQCSFGFPHETIFVNMHKNRTKNTTEEHYSALKRHLLPRYRHFF